MPEGVNPKGTKQPEDELSARLRALAQLKTPDAALPNADNNAAPGGAGSGEGEGNYALKDFIRAQILRRWLPDLSIPGARDLPVLVRVRLLKSGVIDDVVIVDQERFHHRQGVPQHGAVGARCGPAGIAHPDGRAG